MPGGRNRPLDWEPDARAAFRETLARVAGDDPRAADLIRERVSRALDLIAGYPGIGTPGSRRGHRRYPVARTGHVISYRSTRQGIVIMQWYRAKKNVSH
jgi:plasmid stabilization system protein ParE